MKIVGLNIGEGRVAATVVQKQFGKTELLDSFSATYGSAEELAALLKERAKAWSGGRIVSSLPGNLFTQRTVTFPFSDRKKIDKALPFEIEDLLPFGLEEVVLDHLVLDGGVGGKTPEAKVLGLILPKAMLRRHLDLLSAAGIAPQALVPSFAGLAAVAKMMPSEGTLLMICGRDL